MYLQTPKSKTKFQVNDKNNVTYYNNQSRDPCLIRENPWPKKFLAKRQRPSAKC